MTSQEIITFIDSLTQEEYNKIYTSYVYEKSKNEYLQDVKNPSTKEKNDAHNYAIIKATEILYNL